MFLELSDGGQRVNRVPGKPADRLRDDEVNLACQRIGDHALEAFSVLGAGARDAFVGVDLHKLPVLSGFDELRVVVDLRFIAGELLVVVCGDSGVGSDLSLTLRVDRRSGKPADACRDGGYFPLLFQYFSLLICFILSLILLRRSSV